MTAKEYLSQLKWLGMEIQEKEEELERLRARAASCSAPALTGMPGSHNAKDKIGEAATKIVELERYLNGKKERLIQMELKIIKELDKMKNPAQRILLCKRYMDCKNWEQISKEMEYSIQRCYQIHGDALREFAKIHKGK